jgi:anion-transporting  ArsA/GET3 family ATPase
MNVEQFCSASRVVIVAGKGGVGKTTVTAALATAAARAGVSVLIVEVEGKSGLAAAFGSADLTYEERGLRRVSRRLARSGALDVVATAVPGMKDILVLGKIKQLERAEAAELIVIDAPAAGHAVTFLLSPRGLLDAVRVGPVRSQAEDVIAMLQDPTRCRVLLVALPEETPVNELVDTAFALEDRVGVKLGPVVVNQLPESLHMDGVTADRDAATAGLTLTPHEAAALDAAASFRAERHALAQEQASRLARRLPLPQLHLPFLFGEIGPESVAILADALAAEIAALPESV